MNPSCIFVWNSAVLGGSSRYLGPALGELLPHSQRIRNRDTGTVDSSVDKPGTLALRIFVTGIPELPRCDCFPADAIVAVQVRDREMLIELGMVFVRESRGKGTQGLGVPMVTRNAARQVVGVLDHLEREHGEGKAGRQISGVGQTGVSVERGAHDPVRQSQFLDRRPVDRGDAVIGISRSGVEIQFVRSHDDLRPGGRREQDDEEKDVEEKEAKRTFHTPPFRKCACAL